MENKINFSIVAYHNEHYAISITNYFLSKITVILLSHVIKEAYFQNDEYWEC